MRSSRVFHAVDSHTEGMPTRVITGGVGLIPGATMNDRRLHFIAHLDHIRRLLMNEPRGHSSMSGAILQPPSRPDCDYGVVYIEASGCLPMCGHGTMGVATVLVETGMVAVTEPRTVIRLDTPAGLVVADVEVHDGRAVSVTLENVPSFTERLDATIGVEGLGEVPYSIAFGGNFYAMVDLDDVGLPFDRSRAHDILTAGLSIMEAINTTARRNTRPSRASTTCTTWSSSRRVPTPACRGTRWRSTRGGSTGRPAAPGRARGWPSCTPAVNCRCTRTLSTSRLSAHASSADWSAPPRSAGSTPCCQRSPAALGSPAPPSIYSTPTIRSRRDSNSEHTHATRIRCQTPPGSALSDVLIRAASAAPVLAETSPHDRARALVAAADRLDESADELVAIAVAETELAEGRLRGELQRTTWQLRLFAEVVAEGAYLDARIDDADPDYVVGPRPDVRRVNVPVGPVLVFAALNFPFAFSVAGGDTAAALAAGNPVIVKAHEGHPRLSRATARIVTEH